jgi:predicted methyltransferase
MKEEHLQDITLINGDCMDYMRTLPDKAFDLAIVISKYYCIFVSN